MNAKIIWSEFNRKFENVIINEDVLNDLSTFCIIKGKENKRYYKTKLGIFDSENNLIA